MRETNRQQVRKLHPRAFSYRLLKASSTPAWDNYTIWDIYTHINDALVRLGSSSKSAKAAWADAAKSIREGQK